MLHRYVLLSLRLLCGVALCLTSYATAVRAQGQTDVDPLERDVVRLERTGDALPAGLRRSDSETTAASAAVTGERMSRRQTLLIGGLAVSMGAYGYFLLKFNNSRGDSEDAAKAYEEDVLRNAQAYADQGVALDEIQTFKNWQNAYDDAKSAREWAARAGFVAILVGFFAILDAATSHDAQVPPSSGLTVRPTVGMTAAGSDFLVGARVKF